MLRICEHTKLSALVLYNTNIRYSWRVPKIYIHRNHSNPPHRRRIIVIITAFTVMENVTPESDDSEKHSVLA